MGGKDGGFHITNKFLCEKLYLNAVELTSDVGRNKPALAGVSGKLTGRAPETVVARPYSGLQPFFTSDTPSLARDR